VNASDSALSPSRVFVSHASADADRGMLLAMQLEQEGIACWIAPRDIAAGRRYAEGILDGIDGCSVFLVLFSAAANSSPHVGNEIEHAASQNKPILLVRTDETDPGANSQISFFLRSHQWFDASGGGLSSHLERLVRDVRRIIEGDESAQKAQASQHPDLSVAEYPIPTPASGPVITREPPAGPRSIGIDVSANRIRACVVALDQSDAFSSQETAVLERVPTARNARGLVEEVSAIARTLADEEFGSSAPAGIGIAVPGQVDLRAGTLKFGPNLFGARNLSFGSHFSSNFPRVPVRVDNDVRCATRCEIHLGVGRQFNSFACVFVGTGVGSGNVIDRRLHFGHNFCAGEIGHTKIAPSGPPCACGQIGCLESFVKTDAVVARANAKAVDSESRGRATLLSAPPEEMGASTIIHALEEGDEAAVELATEIGEHLGRGISNYLNLVNPAAVVIGGALMNGFFFHMIDEISDAVQRNAIAEVANTPIVQCAHNDDGIATGAALMFHPDDAWPFQ
jgi:glucokinase